MEKQTSEGAFYNFEVGNIVEEIGGPRSIGVCTLCVDGGRPVRPAGLDSGWRHGRGLEEMLMPRSKTDHVFKTGSSHSHPLRGTIK